MSIMFIIFRHLGHLILGVHCLGMFEHQQHVRYNMDDRTGLKSANVPNSLTQTVSTNHNQRKPSIMLPHKGKHKNETFFVLSPQPSYYLESYQRLDRNRAPNFKVRNTF